MDETTHTAAPTDTPTAQYGWCHWHQGVVQGVRLIDAIEQGSGPGITQSACRPCREEHGLVPLADRP
ncbi:hypothetical protein ACL02U_29950 [Streptomyces sp. MS06]|uniref:hypothetical protein n=1 Tax=Streptomyces sp. MS06 TaxID=3385974 RepID=UPI0039A225E9